MSHPYYHALSSARRFGGEATDYLPLHNWMDQTKAHVADARHRLVLHNSFGIFLGEQFFGVTFTRPSDGKEVPTRPILERHVEEDFAGVIPSLAECFAGCQLHDWMFKGARKLSRTYAKEDTAQ